MFEPARAEAARLIEAHLMASLAPRGDLPVIAAMRHALRGGKRLRGFLTLQSAALHEIAPANALDAACAIEAMHAYSLVHDDLPAMDDDDLRRGEPTIHIQWDEATAILAGDALQTLAFEFLTSPALGGAEARIRLVAGLAQAAGCDGMVRGQALDLAAETAGTPLDLAAITTLQDGKTGALISWAATAGAHLAGADPAPLARYARALGLAFQIADDIMDVAGDAAKAGKRLRKDEDRHKATFVSLLGLEGARARARDLVAEAEAALAPYGPRADALAAAARFVITRES
jgi:farnesyl diphosphate synthase